jgi:DNA-binding YbaB/EbfC family protein
VSGPDDISNPNVLRDLMQAAQKMQAEVARVTDELARRTIEGESGGGLVRCAVSGTGDVLSLTIDPAVASMSGADPVAARKMIEDLTVAAVNAALEQARQVARTEMARVTGGVGLPSGMFGV